MTGHVAAAMTIEYVTWAKHPFASVPRTVNVEGPSVVGVPATTPAGGKVTPAGSVPLISVKV
jgi:hypothetical protein